MVDVPFIAQSVDLCGGAAAAMVLRYWGAADVQAEDFAALVNPGRRGISTRDLARALESRGLVVRPINAEPRDARREVESGRPVIALIDGGARRLHYVVIVAWASERVLFHDPSLGPFRTRTEAEFLRSWKATGGFALLVTPGAKERERGALPISSPRPRKGSECDPLVDHATSLARGADPELAVPDLVAAAQICPADPRPHSALAGVRFRQKRWTEAADFAREAAERDESDPEVWRLLGASLYLSDASRSALAAWNRIDEPRLDRVQLEGLIRTRPDIATAVVGLQPRETLTLDAMALAERRLDQLPTASNGTVSYRPRAGGRADVVAVVGEGGLLEPPLILALHLGTDLWTAREARLRFNSPTGRGEVLEVGGRFASRRPAAWVSLETPRLAGLPGVVSLTGLWDRQTYGTVEEGSPVPIVETRVLGAMDWSHWETSALRLGLGVSVERFDGNRTYASVRGGADRRGLGDRLALVADGGYWVGIRGARGFADLGGAAAYRSSTRPSRVRLLARLDARRATPDAPLALWPGAGTGMGRAPLLRGSPLLLDGALVGEAFGRGLLHGTAEAEVLVEGRALVRVGLAVFGDWAKPWDTTAGPGPARSLFAIGAGLRIHAPGSTALRIDVAKRPGEAGIVLSAGVIPPWPR